MARTNKGKDGGGEGTGEVSTPARCVAIAEELVTTDHSMARFLSAMLADLASGRVDVKTGNAMSNVVGKQLKLVELRHRYGKPGGEVEREHSLTLELG